MSIHHTLATVDFSRQGKRVFVGRLNGENARELNNIEALDQSDTSVVIKFPDNVRSVNSSFFLGFLETSIKRIGDKNKFLTKYRFECPDFIKETLDRYIDRTLRKKSPLL